MTKLSRDLQRLVDRRTVLRAKDGAIIDPVVDEANGVQWFFKYRKNTPGKFKWIAMGKQQPLIDRNVGGTITITPINTLVLAAGSLTVPFWGEYWWKLDAQLTSSSLTVVRAGMSVDGVAMASYTDVFLSGSGNVWVGEEQDPVEVLAQHTMTAGFQTTVLGPTQVAFHFFKIDPRRIAV